MGVRTSLLALAALVAGSNPALAADAICARLRALELTKPAPSEDAKDRRWIEFHWGFDNSPGTIWSWGCRSSRQQIARETCTWLTHHTNQEFRTLLPVRIMSCYGYRMPRTAGYDWDVEGAIELHGRGGRLLVLQIVRHGLPDYESAVRLTLMGRGEGYDPDAMPAIEHLPPDTKN